MAGLKVKFAHVGWWKLIPAMMIYILRFSSHFAAITRIKKEKVIYHITYKFLYTKKTVVNEDDIEKDKYISYGLIYIFKCSSFSCLFVIYLSAYGLFII